VSGAVDLASVAAAFGGLLRRAGVATSAEQAGRFVRAIAVTAPGTLDDLYWVGRITLVSDLVQLDAYDRVFDQVFRGVYDLADARGDLNAPPTAARRSVGQPGAIAEGRNFSVGGDRGDPEASGRDGDIEVDVAMASREERLATTDFAELTDEELRDLRELMGQIRLSVPLRPARRHHRHHHGERLDLRATLRRSRRSGGDPIEHIVRRARERPRKLVVLCDISGSMAPYSRACIQLLHAAAAAGGSRAEVFTFATRLTRLTRALAVADPDAALASAASTAPDWNGGTRVGAALKEFVDTYGRRGVARGAVVVIVSDGWDRDDPHLVGEQMARLRRLAHRIVWINPRHAAPGFAPLAGGMAAALPHCDALVSGNTLVALRDAMGALDEGGLTRRPPRRARARERARDPLGT
jgi:hypothetical protein